MSDPPVPPSSETLVAISRAVTTARLLSGLVHEINNALLVISGTVEVLGQRTDLPEPVVRSLDRIRRQTERTAAASAQVTAFTRAPLDARGPVELGELARAAVDLRRFAATRAGLTLDYTLAGGPVTVTGNAGALQQAILNLIITAEQALAGTRGRIAVTVASDASGATVRVADNRTAADADRATALTFEPFAAGRPPREFSGLNLFAARAIAMAHGGELNVDTDAAFALVMRVPALAADRSTPP